MSLCCGSTCIIARVIILRWNSGACVCACVCVQVDTVGDAYLVVGFLDHDPLASTSFEPSGGAFSAMVLVFVGVYVCVYSHVECLNLRICLLLSVCLCL